MRFLTQALLAFAFSVGALADEPGVDIAVKSIKHGDDQYSDVLVAVTNNGDHEFDSITIACTALSDNGDPSDVGYTTLEKLSVGETAYSKAQVEAPEGATVDSISCRVDVALP